MRKLASLGSAEALVGEVGAFTDVLMLALQSFLAVTKHSKVATDAFTSPDAHMRVRTVRPRASTSVGKMHAERRTLWRRVV